MSRQNTTAKVCADGTFAKDLQYWTVDEAANPGGLQIICCNIAAADKGLAGRTY
jgi:hypothetical protein